MRISVWDTYVLRNDGKQMHFDILVPVSLQDEPIIFDYGKEYLKGKPFETGDLTSNECRFCHMESASADIENEIKAKGYYIIEMENCN